MGCLSSRAVSERPRTHRGSTTEADPGTVTGLATSVRSTRFMRASLMRISSVRGFRARERARCAKAINGPYLLLVVDIQEKEQVWTRESGVC